MKNKKNKKVLIIIVSILITFTILFFSTRFLISKLKGTAGNCSISSQIESEKSNIKEGEILAEIKDDSCYIKFDTNEVAKMSSDSGKNRKYNVNVIVGFKDIKANKKIKITLKEGLLFTEEYKGLNDSIEIGEINYDEPLYYLHTTSTIINYNSSYNVITGSNRFFYIKENDKVANKAISFNFTVSPSSSLDFSSIENAIKIELFEDDKLINETSLKYSEYDFTTEEGVAGSGVGVYFNPYTPYADINGNYYANGAGSSIGHESYHNVHGNRNIYFEYIKSYFLVPKVFQYMGLINSGTSVWNTGSIYKDESGNVIQPVKENLTDIDDEKFNDIIGHLALNNTIISKDEYELYSFNVEKIYSSKFGLTPSWKYIGPKDRTKDVIVIPLKYEYKTYGMTANNTVYNDEYKINRYKLTSDYKLVLPADGSYCNIYCALEQLQSKPEKHVVNTYNNTNIIKEHMDVATPLGYYFYNNESSIPAYDKVLHFKFFTTENNKEISNINVDNVKLIPQKDYTLKNNGETYEIAYRKKIVSKSPSGDINVSFSEEMIKDVHIILNKEGNSRNIEENYNFLLTREKVNSNIDLDSNKRFKINYVDENGNIINEYFHELMYYIGEIPGNYFISEGAFQWNYVYNGTLDHKIQEKILNDDSYKASFMNYFRIEDNGFSQCEKNPNNLSLDKKTCTDNTGSYVSTKDTLSKINVILPTQTNGSKYIFRGYVDNNTISNEKDMSFSTGKSYTFNYPIKYYDATTSTSAPFVYDAVIYIKDVFRTNATDVGFENIRLKSLYGSVVEDENYIDNFHVYKDVLIDGEYYIVLVSKDNINLTKPMLGFKNNRTDSKKYSMELTFDVKIPINYSPKEPINYFKDIVYITTYNKKFNGAVTTYYSTYLSNDKNKKITLYKVDKNGKATNEEVLYAHYAATNTAYRVLSTGDIDSQILGKNNDRYYVWENEDNNINTFSDNATFRINLKNSTGKEHNNSFEIYIPIPKKDKKLFVLSLDEAFKYSTNLTSNVKVSKLDNYNVYYANVSDITSYADLKSNNIIWGSYDDIKDINLIKIVFNQIDKDEIITIDYTLNNTKNINIEGSQYFTYTLYRNVENVAGEIKEGWITGNTIGIKNEYPIHKVTIKHLDKNNNEVSEEVVKELSYLSDYSLSPVNFSDYSYKYLYWERNGVRQTNPLDKITVEQDEEIIIRYSTLKKVAINYVDEKNNPLRKPIYIQGYDVEGALFEYIPDKIDSYILNTIATNKINNNFNGKALTINFSGELPAAYYIVYSDLPSTLDNIVIYLIILISSLTLLIGIIMFVRKRKNK